MDTVSYELNASEKPIPSPEESEDKQDLSLSNQIPKTKPIKKNKKGKAK